MKITPEERKLLACFSAYVAHAIGLPKKTGPATMAYLIERFALEFDRNCIALELEIDRVTGAAHG